MAVTWKARILNRYSQQISAVALGHNPFTGLPSKRALSRIAYFPHTQVGFSRVQKNANTFVMQIFADIESRLMQKAQLLPDFPGDVEDLKDYFLVGRNNIRVLRSVRHTEIIAVRRNPYSRTLSAFLDKFRLDAFRQKFGMFDLTPTGYEKFLRWLAIDGLFLNSHWAPQVMSLLPLHYYSEILTQENLEQDLEDFLGRLRPSDVAMNLRRRSSDENAHNRFAEGRLYEFYSSEARDVVTELYASDFASLGYSTDIDVALSGGFR